MKECDSCGKPLTEDEAIQAVNENFVPQEGIFYCGKCAFGTDEEEE